MSVVSVVLVVVVLTVILFGGTTASMLELFGIRVGCVDEHDDSDDEFDIEAPRLPLTSPSLNSTPSMLGSRRFGNSTTSIDTGSRNMNTPGKNIYKDDVRSRNDSSVSLSSFKPTVGTNGSHPIGTSSHNSSSADLVNDDDELNASDVDDLLLNSHIASNSNINTNDPNNNGVLGALLSAEEHVKWFTKFDEQVLKPVLLDTIPHQNRKNYKDDNHPGHGHN